MSTIETVPYIPQHLQPGPDIASVLHGSAERAQDVVRTAFVRMQTAAMAVAERRAAQWEDMPRWRRAIAGLGFTGVATVLALTARTTGAAAHGLEESGLLSVPTGGGMGMSAFDHLSHTPAMHDSPHGAHSPKMTLTAYIGHGDGTLPADLDDAPDLGALGHYNPQTGHGTIWYQVMKYADEMGYDDLSEKEKPELVAKALSHMGLSGSDARHLHSDYRPELPSQHTFQSWLTDVGAKRTHAADRAPVATAPTHGQEPPAGISGATPHPTPAATPPPAAQPHADHLMPHMPGDKEVVHIPPFLEGVNWTNVAWASVPFAVWAALATVAEHRYNQEHDLLHAATTRRKRRLRSADTVTTPAALDEETEEHPVVGLEKVGYIPGQRFGPQEDGTHDVSVMPPRYVEARNRPAAVQPAILPNESLGTALLGHGREATGSGSRTADDEEQPAAVQPGKAITTEQKPRSHFLQWPPRFMERQ